jgi:AraC-like DNA-binding protein
MNGQWVKPPFRGYGEPRRGEDIDTARAIAKAKQFIDDHFREPINLDRLAAFAGLSRFSLAKQFRQRVGISPYRYVCQVRVRHAQLMMAQGQRPTDIASEVGFFDQSHLARHFKRACGMTPREYISLASWSFVDPDTKAVTSCGSKQLSL